MAANMTVIFQLIDQMSDALSTIASNGDRVVESWEASASAADSAFGSASTGAQRVAETCSGVASAAQEAGNAMQQGAESTDYWTAAVGNYDKEMLEAVYSTEELVQMGLKSADALQEEASAADQAAEAADELGDAAEESGEQQEEMGKKGVEAIQALSDLLAAAGIIKLVREIGEAFMEAAEDAARFESSIAQLQTIAGAEHLGELTQDINELSRETGIASSDLAIVAYNAISAGSAVEDAVSTASAASKLATAGFTDTTSALSVLSTAMNSYGEAAGTATQISDSLITVQNLGVTTVADLSMQMGRAIAVASGYSVSLGNLEAAYISTTKSGINTARSTTYISGMLNELGSASSDVSTILQETTGKTFGQLMQSGASLADVLGILYDSVNGDSEAFMNLWGSAMAGMAASSIINQGLDQFNANLQAVENSAGATEQAYAVMADTTEHAHQRMKNSVEQVSIAFGSALNPAFEKAYDGIASIANAVAHFIEMHPNLTRALTAITVGLGIAAVGIAAVSVVMTGLTAKVVEFGVALNAALGPIGWVSLGISALAGALLAYGLMSDTAKTETVNLTETSRQQYQAIQSLTAEYENACAAYGENSAEALRLRNELTDLQAAYDATRQTVEEFVAECDALTSAHQELMQSYEDSMGSIDEQETNTLALVQRLEDLASANTKTAASENQMKAIIQELNSEIPGLALSYDDLVSGTNNWAASVKRAAAAQAEQQRQAEKYQTYVDALSEQQALEEQIAATEENLALARERLANMSIGPGTSDADRDAYYAAADAVQQYEDKLGELNGAMLENQNLIAEIEGSWEAEGQAAQAALEGATSGEQAGLLVLQEFEGEIQALCAAYDEAYEAAKSSFEGQFGLFDEAQASMDATVANAQKALDSQLEYWQNYNENISTLKNMSAEDLGMTQQNYDALMSYVQDGSAEAAGLAQDLVNNIEAGNTEAVAALGETIGEVQAAREEVAANVAEWQTDFEGKLGELKDSMHNAVNDLDLSAEAQEKATATIDSYISAITAGTGSAVEAANALSLAVQQALEGTTSDMEATVTFTADTSEVDAYQPADKTASARYEVDPAAVDGYTVPDKSATAKYNLDSTAPDAYQPDDKDAEAVYSVNSSNVDRWTPPNKTATLTYTIQTTGSVPGHASGTTDAEDVFVAGEQGPELIVGKAGATVFPAEETERILNAVSAISDRRSSPVVATATTPRTAAFSDYGDTYTMERTLNEGDVLTETIINNGDTIYNYETARENDETGSIIYFPVDTGKDRDTFRETPADAGTKRIILSLEGKGNIEVSGNGADTEQIVAVLYEHLKPALTKIITEEIFEEGDGTYGY